MRWRDGAAGYLNDTGRRLKLFQKEQLVSAGVRWMYWTYDPLVSRNAHLNLNRLGAAIDEFAIDMYGSSDSELHQLGTDRFVVKWDMQGEVPGDTSIPDPARPKLGPAEHEATSGPPPEAPEVEVLIPDDIEVVEARDFGEALSWRHSTRWALSHYLGRGYQITGFLPGTPWSSYILSDPSTQSSTHEETGT